MSAPDTRTPVSWYIYMILCSDESLYTGITIDVERRLRQHEDGTGAKYFRGRQPRRLLYLEGGHTRSTAGKREMEIKGMKRADKCRLASSDGNELARYNDARRLALQLDGAAVTGLPEASSSVEHTVLLGDVVQQPADHKPVDISHQ